MSLPDWVRPVVDYMLTEGLPGTLRIASVSLLGSSVIGITLGTLLTIHFRPTRWLIRLYIEIWRGLPILVQIFFFFFGLPQIGITLSAFTVATISRSEEHTSELQSPC